MQLMMKRDQRKGGMFGGKTIYSLDVRAEYSPAEKDLINTKKLGGDLLFQSKTASAHVDRAKRACGRSVSALYPYEHCPIVAIRHSPNMLYKLLCRPDVPRIYASSPITKPRSVEGAENRARAIAEFDRFRSVLAQEFTVFDPLTIDEFPLVSAYKRAKEQNLDHVRLLSADQWEIPAENTLCKEDRRSFDLTMSDVSEVVTEIAGNESKHEVARETTSRDFRMIDQSDLVVVYRPTYHRSDTEWSTGTLHEAVYAKQVGKPVLVIRDPNCDGNLASDTIGLELPPAHRFNSIHNLEDPEHQADALREVIQSVKEIAKAYVTARGGAE